ncbi:sugar phosphate isomerase/epimerase [bacterium]|nr:sugar phosphate isomerase/epimerase [bacterium]
MKLSMNLVSLRKDPLEERLKAIAEAGFEGVGLWVSDVDEYCNAGGKLEILAALLKELKLEVPEICALGGWHLVEDKTQVKAEVERIGRMCKDLGINKTVVICPVAWEAEAPLENSVNDYKELCNMGKEWGLIMGLEFLGMRKGINNPVSAWEIVKEAGCENGGVVVDVFHLLKGGGKPADLLSIPGTGIALVHFNDIPADRPLDSLTDADRLLPGEGVAPLRELLENLKQVGYEGWFSIEIFNPQHQARPPLEVCKEAIERAKGLLI